MGKYSRELSENLEQKVKMIADSMGLSAQGVTVEPILLKSKKTYGEVIKSSELISLFTGDPDMVCVALNEEILENFADNDQNMLVEALLNQIFVDSESGKISIIKPELMASLGMFHKYKNAYIENLASVYYAFEQKARKEKEEKEAKKAERAEKKRLKAAQKQN